MKGCKHPGPIILNAGGCCLQPSPEGCLGTHHFRLKKGACWGMQAAKKELAMAIALSGKRFSEGSATGDRRHSAEKEYAEAMARIGGSLSDAAIMAMAAEAFMNLSPWDYYEVSSHIPLTILNARCLSCAQITCVVWQTWATASVYSSVCTLSTRT